MIGPTTSQLCQNIPSNNIEITAVAIVTGIHIVFNTGTPNQPKPESRNPKIVKATSTIPIILIVSILNPIGVSIQDLVILNGHSGPPFKDGVGAIKQACTKP